MRSNQTGNNYRGEKIVAEKDRDWFELFWAKKRQDLQVDSFRYKTGDQLYVIAKQME